MGETILAYFLTLHNKIGKQSTILTGELTVNCMSLSLLEEDLEEKGLVAGKTEKTRGQHRTEGGKNVMSTSYTKSGPLFFSYSQSTLSFSRHLRYSYASFCLLLLCFGFFVLSIRIWNQRKFWQNLLTFMWFWTALFGCSVPMWGNSFVMAHYIPLASRSLSFSSLSHSYIHTNQRWVTIIAPSLRRAHTLTKQKKNLFSTHTYTNTHLHSAAVCAQIQCLRAK